jgi:tRNA-dihydrouridine synthase A
MLGRAAYHEPWLLAGVDPLFFGASAPATDRFDVIDPMIAYARRHVASGGRLREVTRHLLGLFNGLPGARRWRQLLSDARRLAADDPALIAEAADCVASPRLATS